MPARRRELSRSGDGGRRDDDTKGLICMLTPQDIESKELPKAVFGGYDMTSVDEFLEQLAADYATLYKDNMVLKGKLKVLVEKVEEYRSTEDAMRMALLTAQKMSDDMMAETKVKCDEMLAAAARDSDESRAKAAEDITHEDMKLEAAKVKTAAFVSASRQILGQYEAFLEKLDSVNAQYGGVASAPAEPAEPAHEPVFSPEPERVRMPAAPAAQQESEPEPEAAPEAEPAAQAKEEPEPAPAFSAEPPAPPEGVDLGEELEPDEPAEKSGSKEAAADDMTAATRRIDIDAVRRFYSGDGETKRMAWDEEDELTTPRPKFDFSDLRFGANYEDEEPKKKGGKKDK